MAAPVRRKAGAMPATWGSSRRRDQVAIMGKRIQPPFRATARDRTDPASRFEHNPNLKSPTLKPRNPRAGNAGVPWGSLEIAVRRSARDDNQKPMSGSDYSELTATFKSPMGGVLPFLRGLS